MVCSFQMEAINLLKSMSVRQVCSGGERQKQVEKVWDVIRNGPVASQHSPTLDGIDFTSDSHDLLGLHANAGITFDLEPMRDVVGSQRLRLTTEVGYFGAAGDYHADVWILLDGKTAVEFRHLSRHQGLKHVDLEVPTSNRFLTLIATDGGNGYSHDQIGFGDARISAVDSRRHRMLLLRAWLD